jgi:hypothetical protein
MAAFARRVGGIGMPDLHTLLTIGHPLFGLVRKAERLFKEEHLDICRQHNLELDALVRTQFSGEYTHCRLFLAAQTSVEAQVPKLRVELYGIV